MEGDYDMVNYDPFWQTLEKNKVTKYQLIYHWGISSNTLRRMAHGEAINTNTLNELCLILGCKAEDIIKFEATASELEEIQKRREQIAEKYRHKK